MILTVTDTSDSDTDYLLWTVCLPNNDCIHLLDMASIHLLHMNSGHVLDMGSAHVLDMANVHLLYMDTVHVLDMNSVHILDIGSTAEWIVSLCFTCQYHTQFVVLSHVAIMMECEMKLW